MGNINADNDNKKARSKSNFDSFKMPKNLRQVGNIDETGEVIYIEDYVMSYMKQLSERDQNESKIAILVGKYIYNEEGKNIFINGAIEMEDININENFTFADESWTSIYEKIKEYFTDVEIIGWAIIGFSIFYNSDEKIKNIHLENFRGADKVLLKFDCMEKEEKFYFAENNQIIKQNGYYIYYDKNEEMQNYMIDHNQREITNEAYDDIATKKIRNVIEEKQTNKAEKNISHLTYAIGTLMTVIVLVIATAMLRNYHQMKNLETALYSLTERLETPTDKEVINQGSSKKYQNSDNESETIIKETEEKQKVQETQSQQYEESSIIAPESTEESANLSTDVETVLGNISQTEEKPTSIDIIEEASDSPTEAATEKETEEAATEETTETEAETSPVVNEVKYYIVRPGDSLAGICNELYNTSSKEKIEEIIGLNDIGNKDKIYPGQQLIVP